MATPMAVPHRGTTWGGASCVAFTVKLVNSGGDSSRVWMVPVPAQMVWMLLGPTVPCGGGEGLEVLGTMGNCVGVDVG